MIFAAFCIILFHITKLHYIAKDTSPYTLCPVILDFLYRNIGEEKVLTHLCAPMKMT